VGKAVQTAERARDVDWRRAVLKGIPYLGDSLDEVLYGALEQARWDRVERTLAELAENMRAQEIPPDAVKKEEFANLLEDVAPDLARATGETKRVAFRELLLNASQIEPGAPQWEEARLAHELLARLSLPALEILAGLSKLGVAGEPGAIVRSLPGGASSEVVLRADESARVRLDHGWTVTSQALRELLEPERQLVLSGGYGAGYKKTGLTGLGEFLVRWTLSARPDVGEAQ